MDGRITLEEVVSAFSEVCDEPCNGNTWIWGDLRLDNDELGWTFLYIQSEANLAPVSFEIDPYKFLPAYRYWPFHRTSVDIRIKELYALGTFLRI